MAKITDQMVGGWKPNTTKPAIVNSKALNPLYTIGNVSWPTLLSDLQICIRRKEFPFDV